MVAYKFKVKNSLSVFKICSLTHSLTHSLIHSLTHSLTLAPTVPLSLTHIWRPATLLNRLQHWCFPVKFAKILRTLILKNICERMLFAYTHLLPVPLPLDETHPDVVRGLSYKEVSTSASIVRACQHDATTFGQNKRIFLRTLPRTGFNT